MTPTKEDTVGEPASDRGAQAVNESETVSRTWIHIFGAFFIASLLGIILFLVSMSGGDARKNRILAMQQGAKVDLKLIADSQAKFFEVFGFYTTDLNRLGINPKTVYYKFGFTRPGDVLQEGVDPSIKDLDALKKAVPRLQLEFTPSARVEFDSITSLCPDCTATRTTFKAAAAANLDSDPELDVWTIDEKGQVVHVVNDLKPD